jgi:hypothetical protein
MPNPKNGLDPSKWNHNLQLPFQLRLRDFEMAMQDVYDFFRDVNAALVERGLERLDDMLRKATMSGLLSDMLTASLAKHSRSLAVNLFHNGHPDLIVRGVYPENSVKAGSEGVEIKTTRKPGGAVDTHGARDQWMGVFVYGVDNATQPARKRMPMTFTEVYLARSLATTSARMRVANWVPARQRCIARASTNSAVAGFTSSGRSWRRS